MLPPADVFGVRKREANRWPWPHSSFATAGARSPPHANMSAYLTRATGMATKAADVVKTRVLPPALEYYHTTMAKNAEYVVKDPVAASKLGKQLVFSNLAK